jgi:DNA/RNA-binding domain of Phe-tRNA-synthetase-like protein
VTRVETLADEAMTAHEKECALAAIAARIEAAEKMKDKPAVKEWRKFYREILAS